MSKNSGSSPFQGLLDKEAELLMNLFVIRQQIADSMSDQEFRGYYERLNKFDPEKIPCHPAIREKYKQGLMNLKLQGRKRFQEICHSRKE